jgi:hypothetical protein
MSFDLGVLALLHQNLIFPFQSGQNRLPPFQAIPVRPKLTTSIPLNPISNSYTGGNIDPVAKHLISLSVKPMALIFQAPSNVLTYLPLSSHAKTDFLGFLYIISKIGIIFKIENNFDN